MYINLITLVTHFNFLSPHDRLLQTESSIWEYQCFVHWILPYVTHHNKEWEVSNWSNLCLILLPSRSNKRKDLLILVRAWVHILMECLSQRWLQRLLRHMIFFILIPARCLLLGNLNSKDLVNAGRRSSWRSTPSKLLIHFRHPSSQACLYHELVSCKGNCFYAP